ncbi:hypothetical protein TgHK011_006803 [Trichoderma gracile]|nr:hypothetical protein TgHK011_006803 [Trichoderma gracile]
METKAPKDTAKQRQKNTTIALDREMTSPSVHFPYIQVPDHKGHYAWSGRPVPDRSAIRNQHRAAGKCRQVQGDCRRCNAAPTRPIPPILRPGDLPRRSEVLASRGLGSLFRRFLNGGAQVLSIRTSALAPGYSRLCARAVDFPLASCDASFSLPSSQSFSRSLGLPLPLFEAFCSCPPVLTRLQLETRLSLQWFSASNGSLVEPILRVITRLSCSVQNLAVWQRPQALDQLALVSVAM